MYDVLIQEIVAERQERQTFSSRTVAAVMQRFQKARAESLKSEGIIASIKAKIPTGRPKKKEI